LAISLQFYLLFLTEASSLFSYLHINIY